MGGDPKSRGASSSSQDTNKKTEDDLLKEINEEILSLHEYLEKHGVC